MEGNISQISTDLRKSIERDPSAGAKSLITFAKTYAVSTKLKHDALILNLNCKKAADSSAVKKVQQEMLQLVDEIVADFQEKGQSEAAQKSRQALQQLEKHFAQQSAPDDVVFECNGLGKTYRSTGFSLTDINLQLRLGQVTSVVGENGNGKTTLFRIVVGELLHNEGSIAYPAFKGGEENKIRWSQVKQHIAYVPQELPSWDGSLKQVLQFEAAIHGIRGEDNDREVDYIIQRLDLEDHLDKKWSQLSGGFKLRFALAKALVWKPKLLVIDEPLANLDFKTQLVILKDLRNLAKSFRYPMAILLSSQHLHEIEAVSDKVLFLKNGAAAFYGKMNEMGTLRDHNTYELNCNSSLSEVRAVFSDFPHEKLYYNGIAYVIITGLDVDYRQVLQHILSKGLEITYFRNISQSIKQLFE